MSGAQPAPGGGLAFHVLTLFPGFFDGALQTSILGKAQQEGIFSVHLHDFREQATDRHRTVDDAPYGGGSGMVIMGPPVLAALEALPGEGGPHRAHRILLGPGGARLTQGHLDRWATMRSLALICGRYEGIDARVGDHFVDEEVSLGDFVLAGGEAAALTIIEGVARLLPGVLGNQDSLAEESFRGGLLEYPQFTRPATLRGVPVPEVLLSGDHARIAAWRAAQAEARTRRIRPDLLAPSAGSSDP